MDCTHTKTWFLDSEVFSIERAEWRMKLFHAALIVSTLMYFYVEQQISLNCCFEILIQITLLSPSVNRITY